MPQKTVVYASVGPELTHYDLDVENAALSKRDTVTLPANVHYAWPHASRQFLYVATSNSASGDRRLCRRQAPCQRVSHRSRDRRLVAAWRADRSADPADPHDQ